MKEEIIQEAITLFGLYGYDKTSIRDIAKNSNCSLPMVYYYFKNKEALYDYIAYDMFLELNEKMNHQTSQGDGVKSIYKAAIKSRINLQGYDRIIYKIALSTYYSNRVDLETYRKLAEWQKTRFNLAYYTLLNYAGIDNMKLARILSRVVENIITKSILFEQEIPENEIIEELDLFFDLINVK